MRRMPPLRNLPLAGIGRCSHGLVANEDTRACPLSPTTMSPSWMSRLGLSACPHRPSFLPRRTSYSCLIPAGMRHPTCLFTWPCPHGLGCSFIAPEETWCLPNPSNALRQSPGYLHSALLEWQPLGMGSEGCHCAGECESAAEAGNQHPQGADEPTAGGSGRGGFCMPLLDVLLTKGQGIEEGRRREGQRFEQGQGFGKGRTRVETFSQRVSSRKMVHSYGGDGSGHVDSGI